VGRDQSRRLIHEKGKVFCFFFSKKKALLFEKRSKNFLSISLWRLRMLTWVVVAIGSAVGGMARYGVGLLAARAWGAAFPWGTLLINVVGSFVIALFGALTLADGRLPASSEMRAFVMVGFCGGFTTFSSFSLQTLELLQAGETVAAGLYILGSVLLCVGGAFLGYWLATRLGLPARLEG
jgi:CrcB protein